MDNDAVKKYAAQNKKGIIAAKYSFSENWILFADRICKNYFFRKQVDHKQASICPVCQELLSGEGYLHHIDYDHICQLGENIQVPTGKISRTGKPRIKNMPNCEKCFSENKAFFNSCMERFALVHVSCHGMLHNESKKRIV